MSKFTPISGFPEWLPAQRMAEQQLLDRIRNTFELFGFAPIETRAIEPLSVLLSKGDDKEIYTLRRLHEENDSAEEKWGLHFDLTVPFARYVQEFKHQLHFPFKRYQIQKVWRGERKQEGRYREFYQCDIDVIGNGQLPLVYDAEMPLLLYQVVSQLPIPPVRIKLNNRKVLEGFYRGLGIEDFSHALRIVDKLAKIGAKQVAELLQSELSLSEEAAQKCLALGQIKTAEFDFVDQIKQLGIVHPLIDQGLEELVYVMRSCDTLPPGSIEVDLSIARGLDYYTGSVYEGVLLGHEHIGAVCSGGRYDNLASSDKNLLPGIGVSIGITRILGYLFGRNLLQVNRSTPVIVMIILPDENQRVEARRVAQILRERGISVDIYHLPQNFGKQMQAAEKRGIPYVWFMGEAHQVKNLQTGVQTAVDLATWMPEMQYQQLMITLEK